MPQNNQSIIESPEFKEFCKKNNLEVHNQESINVMLFNIYNDTEKLRKSHLIDSIYDPYAELLLKIKAIEEENKKLREMINEIAKNIYSERPIDNPEEFHTMTLFDKWNK